MSPTTHQSVEHILLTSLGTQAKSTTYEWGGQKATADLAPLALVQLLDQSQRPNHVVAMVTDGAGTTTWPVFEKGICTALGFPPQSVLIPDGRNSDETREILEKVAKTIPEGTALTLDVTQGFRHFPFIFYALALYLTSLRGVEIRGAYYGMVETADPKPIIDLQPLLELPKWFHAVRMFRDQGTTEPIAQLIQPLANRLNEQVSELGKKIGQLSKCGDKAALKADLVERKKSKTKAANLIANPVDYLKKHAFAYESALPLELGKASQQLKASIGQLDPKKFDGLPPLVKELTNTIASVATESAFTTAPANGEWKKNVTLDNNELKRQAQMIDLYLERDQLPLAVGLMREWVVSWAILKCGDSCEIGKWLGSKVRSRYERRLGALGAFARGGITITDEQQKFGTFWNQLTDSLRNVLHHHAMREDALEQPPSSLKSVREFWNQLKVGKIDLPALGGGGGRLLLSPQGTRPGVLFSALKVTKPYRCLVVCSAKSASSIPCAVAHAEFKGTCEKIQLDNPLGGFDEIDDSAARVRQRLLDADEVVANMTGGTTLMGLVIQRLAEEAQRLDRPVRRFALIDRRPPAEQDSKPFVQGDHHWLDA